MATPVTDLVDALKREINVPGFEQLPDITSAELQGYILDGFWEGKLAGLMTAYDVDMTANPPNIEDSSGGDFPAHFQLMTVIIAGLRILRLKSMNLAVNLRAQAGPVEYEQQASATTIRAILDSLERRYAELRRLYSDLIGTGGFAYFDATLQRETAMIGQYLEVQVW